jgi:hypothetical protein
MLAAFQTYRLVSIGVLAVLVSAGYASAQETTVKGGLASAAIAFDREAYGVPDVDERRSGFVFGASFMPGGADRGGWQIEALVVQKGARNLLRQNDRFELTYVEIPVLLHMDFWQKGNSGAFFVAGPSVAFNVQASYVDDGVSEDIGDDIEKVDVGLNLGIGLELGRFVLEGRSNWGMRSAFTVDDVDFKHRTLLLTAGVRFR